MRCNEFIASLLTKEFSTKLNRIISLGSKVTIDRIEEIFKFPGDILMSHLFKSGLLRYDDIVNDLDFWNFAKYTIKGPRLMGPIFSNKYLVNILIAGNSLESLVLI